MKITENDKEDYTNGLCWSLAWEISKITGLPITTVGATGTWCPYKHWYHVVVHIGYNKYLDIKGVSTKKKLRWDWGDEVRDHGTFPNLSEYTYYLTDNQGFNDPDTQHAHTINLAKHLIREYVDVKD
jgi:hypothetical protein